MVGFILLGLFCSGLLQSQRSTQQHIAKTEQLATFVNGAQKALLEGRGWEKDFLSHKDLAYQVQFEAAIALAKEDQVRTAELIDALQLSQDVQQLAVELGILRDEFLSLEADTQAFLAQAGAEVADPATRRAACEAQVELLVRSGPHLLALSNHGLEQILYADGGQIGRVGDRVNYRLDDQLLQACYLESLLQRDAASSKCRPRQPYRAAGAWRDRG